MKQKLAFKQIILAKQFEHKNLYCSVVEDKFFQYIYCYYYSNNYLFYTPGDGLED